MGEHGPNFEREKWLKEQEFRERETSLKERETAVKEREIALKEKDASRSLVTGPLSLAIIGATIAGLANVFVSYHNGDAERALEQSQAEHARIVTAINGDTNVAIYRLKFLLKTQLIAEEPTRSNISNYIDQQPQESTPTTVQPQLPPRAPLAKVSLDSSWLDGGHNQTEVCGGLSEQVKNKYPGKDVIITGMSENNRKDFLGHVTYQYHCQYEVF
ncbi:MAG: hypothetical protein EOS36_30235 [Mesorhizobium sp.]|uniref:hypothetical protein n=1 Tax=Mesorhizobium sp. TaxID=1871066 RepID=UPI000FE66193|nr:hypothetical protein [Mesorhizobium sp.]RWD50757.1 MAG: hypothetical protein EOS36_30235 [Mesorhizobium sp.]RWE30364.1 MAG: hypothetical protein EOS79_32910 [Mesorhizobium sp.]